MSQIEYIELKPMKNFLFEFFQRVNQYRDVGQYVACFLIAISFCQLFFFVDFFFIGNNLIKTSINYTYYHDITIYDFISIAFKASLFIPLFEYDMEVFKVMYPMLIILIYIGTSVLIISIIYVAKCLIQEREVYFTLFLGSISSFFLFFQWTMFCPIQIALLYPFYGSMTEIAPYNHNAFKAINLILVVLFFLMSFVLAILNNDALNKNDNSLCRKDCSIEIMLNFLRVIFIITFVSQLPRDYNNVISIACSLIIFIMIIKQFNNRIFYDETIAKIFGSCLLCYIKIFFNGLIALIWQYYIHDYSFTIILCFFFSYYLYAFSYKRLKSVFMKKPMAELKEIDELILYTDILEEEAGKTIIGDMISGSRIAGFILEHKSTCIQESCPLKIKGELFLPLINKSIVINSEDTQNLYKDEIFLIHLIKEVYMVLGSKFYGKPKFHFAYASFLLYRFGNIKLALIEIENSKKFSFNIQQQYSFYLLKHIANERLLNNQSYIANYAKFNISILDILDVIILDQLGKDLETEIFDCARLKRDFWRSLTNDNLSIEELYRKGNKYIKNKNKVEKIWEQICLITDQNKQINDIYNSYLTIICDNKNGLITKETKTRNDDNDEEHDDLVETRFYDDIGLFIINVTFGPDIGIITYYNRNVCKLFNFKPDELLGKNISILQPDCIGKVHNEILIRFLETGKTRVTGANTPIFVKLKNKLITPVFLLVMPIPTYNDRSEALGLLRPVSSSYFYLLFDEYGIVDSYTSNFAKLDDSLDLEDIYDSYPYLDFFVFYLFPFLLQPIEHLGNKPLFLHENTLLENSQSQVCAYIDQKLFHYLSNVMDNLINNKTKSKINIRPNAKVKIDYDKLTENEKRKFNVYSDFHKSLLKMKEFLITNRHQFSQEGIGGINEKNSKKKQKSNFCDEISYVEQFQHYKTYLEEATGYIEEDYLNESNDAFENHYDCNIIKQVLNCKISLLHFNKNNKMYIMELSIPPNDSDEFKHDNDSFYDKSSSSSRKQEEINKDLSKRKEEEINNKQLDNNIEQNTEDTGSISGKTKINQSSIQNLIQKIRDEKRIRDSFHQSSYMNLIFYGLLLIFLAYTIFIIIYFYQFKQQQNLIFNGFYLYSMFLENMFSLRHLAHIEYIKYNDPTEFPLIELYSLNTTLAQIAAESLIINKNISDLLFQLTDSESVNNIIRIVYPSELGDSYTAMREIENNLIKNNIYITDPKSLILENIVNLLKDSIGIDITNAKFTPLTKADRLLRINQILLHTGRSYCNTYEVKIVVLRNLFNKLINRVMITIKYCSVGLGIVAFIAMLLVFLSLRKMYIMNQKITEKLTSIKIEDIKTIINSVEDFIIMLQGSSVIDEHMKKLNDKNNFKNNITFDNEGNGLDNFDEKHLLETDQLISNDEEEIISHRSNIIISNAQTLTTLKSNSANNEKESVENNHKIKESVNKTGIKKEVNTLAANNQPKNNLMKNNLYNSSIQMAKRKIIRKENIFLAFSMNILLIILIIIAYFILSYVLVQFYNNKHRFLFQFAINIYNGHLNNLLLILNLHDLFISNNKMTFDSTISNQLMITELFEKIKESNLILFSQYSQNSSRFSSSVQNQFNYIFYQDLCNINTTLLTSGNFKLTCSFQSFSYDYSTVFPKGLKYAIDNYSNEIDNLIMNYLDLVDNDANTLYVYFKLNNVLFMSPYILATFHFKQIFHYFRILVTQQFFSNSNTLFVFIIAVSVTCLLLLLLTICTKWLKYSNQIKMEEFMSIKLIAEIPINVIMKNVEILTYLKNYVTSKE